MKAVNLMLTQRDGRQLMNAKILLVELFIFLTLSLSGCAVGTVDTIESGNRATTQSRILIATQNSEFKQAVIQTIRTALDKNSSYIRVIDVKRLPHESIDDYDAVILLNECMAGRPDPRVESFIDITPEKEKIVVLTTGRLDSWKPESPRVDAISSASVMTQAPIIGQSLSDKALEIIHQQKR
jgi:hypothetical protein